MFQLNNVSKKYGDHFALHPLSMTIDKGLHFIIGSSGSGKTTLLKILCGMDQSFEGDVFYCGENIKSLTEQEKSYFYNTLFGFVWQDFNLLEHLTVLENVMIPQHLKKRTDEKAAMKVLDELNITHLANKKVRNLSGGQKQRVAIARELLKNPQVIIADEPTSALDEKTSQATMELLRDISKSRTVIVVTHDTSLIDPDAKVYELDKGELIVAPHPESQKLSQLTYQHTPKLSLSSACKLSIQNTKRQLIRFATTSLSLIVAATLLLVTLSGSITTSGKDEFDQLISRYGETLLDISLYNSFVDASGANNSETDKPSGAIDQNISDLSDLYEDDSKVAFVAYLESFDNISLSVDGKEYTIQGTGNTPSINTLVAGQMPSGDGNQVVVPHDFVATLGITPTEALGKEIIFTGDITDWNNGTPVPKTTSTHATIVGVMDTTVKYDYEGQILEYTVNDSFLFSKTALEDMLQKVGMENKTLNFLIRAKTPSDMIAIKDELNKQGIVPLGRFELIEDLVRLDQQTSVQSESASMIIGMLSLVVLISPAFITAMMRRREYAIYKICGYSKKHLSLLILIESFIIATFSGVLFICISPLMNVATTAFWDMPLLSSPLLTIGIVLILGMGLLSSIVPLLISCTTKISKALHTGDR